jgi:hypothetical protein
MNCPVCGGEDACRVEKLEGDIIDLVTKAAQTPKIIACKMIG